MERAWIGSAFAVAVAACHGGMPEMGAADDVAVLCFPHTEASPSVGCCWERRRAWCWDRHSRQTRARETCSSSSVRLAPRHGALPHNHQDNEQLRMLPHFSLRRFLLEDRFDILAQAGLGEDGPEGGAMQGNGSSARAAAVVVVVRAFGVLDGGTSKARFGLSHVKSRDLYVRRSQNFYRMSRNFTLWRSLTLQSGINRHVVVKSLPFHPPGFKNIICN